MNIFVKKVVIKFVNYFFSIKSKIIKVLKLCPPPCEIVLFSECSILVFISDHIEVKGLCTMGTHNSSCPVPCEETEYPATVSYSTFPSQKALKHFSKKLNQSQKYIR